MPNVNEGFSNKSIKVFGGLAWTRYLSCDPDRSKIGVNLADRDTDPNQKSITTLTSPVIYRRSPMASMTGTSPGTKMTQDE